MTQVQAQAQEALIKMVSNGSPEIERTIRASLAAAPVIGEPAKIQKPKAKKVRPAPEKGSVTVSKSEQVTKLNAARDAYFKKMGYGKYKKAPQTLLSETKTS